MLIALATWLWWRGHAPARFFVLAFGFLIAGGVLRYLRLLAAISFSKCFCSLLNSSICKLSFLNSSFLSKMESLGLV
jgi:hypothetical protein